MTAEQVIKVGSYIKIPDGGLNSIAIVAGCLVLVIFVGLSVCAYRDSMPWLGFWFLVTAIVGGIMMYSLYRMAPTIKEREYQEEVEEWVKTTVDPYIEKLPVEKASIVSMLQTEYGDFNVKFKDSDGEMQEVKAVKVDRTLEESGTPYVKYTKLRTDLGHGVTKGIQTSIVYVSSNVYVPKMMDDEITD